jgi:hypothetical protein
MYSEKTVYVEFCAIHGFRHPLGVLEHVPHKIRKHYHIRTNETSTFNSTPVINYYAVLYIIENSMRKVIRELELKMPIIR